MESAAALLGITLPATAEEIKRAYHRQISRYHPDKVHHLGEEFRALAAEKAARITDAYQRLLQSTLETTAEAGSDAATTEARPQAAGQQPAAQQTGDHAPSWKAVAMSGPSLVLDAAVERLTRSVVAICPRLEEVEISGYAFAGRSRTDWRERLRRRPADCVLVRMPLDGAAAARKQAPTVRSLLPGVEGPIVIFEVVLDSASGGNSDSGADVRRKGAPRNEPGVFTVKVDARNWVAQVPSEVPEFAHKILARLRSSSMC
ncbi:MAG TPA: J domain-containing protein [Vicinamibacterales bacterium]|nr:J domain-containing protein [Vicinamibacterales bacterium]